MPEIQVLDEQTIDKIAAGEVVERPFSVVKELVENAIDAGASAVTVEIRDGGTSLIRVTDNGCGIEAAQIPIAFCRHATSKIRDVEDLKTLSSLGFRGEALSSIAAVSRVELISKTKDELAGFRYAIEGGHETIFEEVGAPEGTTVLVRDLFYNTPARRKFLKTPQTEAGAIGDLVERFALSRADLSFQLLVNGQVRLHTMGNGVLKDVIYQIYGRDLTSHLLPVEAESDGFSVTGFLGKPIAARGNRAFESYFINGRYVKSNLIAKAIEDGYHGFLMQHKYPFTVLLFHMDGKEVDVNVHPNKMELRFSNEQELYRRLSDLVRDTLKAQELIDDVAPKEEQSRAEKPVTDRHRTPEPFEKKRREQEMREPLRYDGERQKDPAEVSFEDRTAEKKARTVSRAAEDGKKERKDEPEVLSFEQETFPDLASEQPRMLSAAARPEHRVIGQLFDTYWLVEYRDRFYMIDQHAAHEKVLYEEMMRRYRDSEPFSQMVSPPFLLTLSPQEENLLKKYQTSFEQLGFSVEPFGGREYAVRAVPTNLYGLAATDLLTDMVDELGDLTEKEAPDLVAGRIASMACKAAVKGNQSLSRAEAEHLIDELLTLENPYFCPHGRPVLIAMTRQEIEKKFKRIVS